MYLHTLMVENFRGLRLARLSFDETTVLIGENDCGKSSLLEALAIALDPRDYDSAPKFQPYHFHRLAPHQEAPVAGPIRIELRFRERRMGEWESLAGSPLAFLFKVPSEELRELLLEIRATPSAGQGAFVSQWSLHTNGAPAQLGTTDTQALAFLRRMNPLIWLHAGSMFGRSFSADIPLEQRTRLLPPQAAQLVERIDMSYSAIMAGTTPDVQDTLKEGFDAARDFIAYASRHFRGQRHHFHQMVAEILGHQIAPRPEGEAPELPHFSGLPAERIGMLLLMASLLRALPDKLTPGSEPIWIIEDPEVQLHPMTLASVQNMMRQIKWQKIITTQSGDVLGAEPLKSLRRLTRQGEILREWRVRPRSLSAEDLRRVGYHLRARHSVASFARCWLLVEGETEFWVLPELARIYGHDFAVEGVVCVEFAQCGLRPLIKLARELGIEWHVLADGDRAGQQYVEQARRFLRGDPLQWRVSALHEHDIESCFYEHGYENVFKRLIGEEDLQLPARRVIERAIGRHSKPMLALELVLAASARGPAGIPPPLARTIKTCVTLARAAPRDKRAVPSNP